MSGVQIDVRSNIDRVVAEFTAATSSAVPTATYRAINRAVDKTATETSREVRKVYNVKDRAVKAAMSKQYANKERLYGRLRIQGARLRLIEFAARALNPWNVKGKRRRPGGGVSVQVLVQGGRKTLRGAFISASTANNYRGGGSMGLEQVFVRKGHDRHPIVSLRSVSIPQTVSNKAVLTAIQLIAAETFDKNFEQQLRFLLYR